MHKVFQVNGGFQIFWCPSHPKHYADKIPASERIYRQKQAAYRRCKQLNDERAKQMQTYAIDLSRLTEEQKGDVSQRLLELQETCLDVKGNVGRVYGISSTVETLQREGHDVKLVYELEQ